MSRVGGIPECLLTPCCLTISVRAPVVADPVEADWRTNGVPGAKTPETVAMTEPLVRVVQFETAVAGRRLGVVDGWCVRDVTSVRPELTRVVEAFFAAQARLSGPVGNTFS